MMKMIVRRNDSLLCRWHLVSPRLANRQSHRDEDQCEHSGPEEMSQSPECHGDDDEGC